MGLDLKNSNMKTRNMISFDWAMKRLLRDKANFSVLEGFLSELLSKKIIIKSILESESNKNEKDDKHNKIDIKVEDENNQIIIIELQFYKEDDFFQRMLYGACKAITEHIAEGEKYEVVRKVISINIVYFDLGTGSDYIYHGTTCFIGLHSREMLALSKKQQNVYNAVYPQDLHPEYYILKVNNFNDVAKNTLDEWIYYIKNNKIKDEFTAKGLDKARKVLMYDNLSDEEKKEYQREVENARIRDSQITTAFSDGKIEGIEQGIEQGIEKEKIQTVINCHKEGLDNNTIAKITNLPIENIIEIIKKVGSC
jgi:predicted transposase/invertase (TIGR01784 family)